MVLVKVAVKGDDVVSLHSRLLESCSGVLFLLGEHFAPGGANMEEDYYAYFVRVVKTFFILFLHIFFLDALDDAFHPSLIYCFLDFICSFVALVCFLCGGGFKWGCARLEYAGDIGSF